MSAITPAPTHSSAVQPTDATPVVVIGAGPIGLAAAAELVQREIPVVVLESGDTVAAGVRSWSHVRLFSEWSQLIAPSARALLEPTGWTESNPTAYPTGGEWADAYLQPLADALNSGDSDRVRTGHRVTAVSRLGRDLLSDTGRDTQPFVVRGTTPEGTFRLQAAAIVDASGTITSPNPLGADGLPADGELELADHLTHAVPDTTDPATAQQHAGRHTAVVGAGHSAMTALIGLADLARSQPGTRITWIRRRGLTADSFGGGAADQLAGRGALGLAAARTIEDGLVEVVEGFRTTAVRRDTSSPDRVALVAEDGRTVDDVDRVVVLTGFRPDLTLTSELRVDLDPSVQAPRALAPLIDPNVHSCGTVPPHGVAELAQPEPGLYTAGMKSYGRAPTFLALTGFEQVRSIVAAIAGDHESAARVELQLPETGVCGGTGLDDAALAELGSADACGVPVAGGLPLATTGGCC
ncbi:putative secreted protein [Euzebya pacifica]|uniref:Putative secreted protein n=1 Tax=Euzebya pacifica TaxID=1608957 RepID=A0A346Y1L0_9ACTN|nr:FAD-dependent oxidoreductase [Euzebya pacifica]AXV08357.1 putative secreted protein [Euzebya pacifica]